MPSQSQLDLQRAPALEVRREPRKKIEKILLLDGYSTRTLACVRSWGKRNIPFAVGGETRCDMSLLSRYAREKFVYASPKRSVSGFISDINRYCDRFQADCVFPTSEAAIMACCEHRAELACEPIIPREQDIRTLFSKSNTLTIADAIGVRAPKTLHITRYTPDAIDRSSLQFPLAIKSDSSEVMRSGRASTSRKTAYVSSRQELERECQSRLSNGETVLLQEFIDGYGVGVSGVFANGQPIALLGHRRIRESNPLGGPSALAESIRIDGRLLEATTSLFQTVGFTGPAMAEYKIDRKTSEPYLMEVNGRFWGTILLAPLVGLDLPYLYWKVLNDVEVLPEETLYEAGMKGRYLMGDLKWLLLCLKGRPAQWPGAFPGRASAALEFFRSFFDRRTRELILTKEDPLPFLGRLIQDFI